MRPAEEKEPERETQRVNLVMHRVVIGNARTHTHTGGDKPQSSTSFRAGRVVYTASASLIRVDLQLPTTPAVSVCLSPAALLDLPDISRASERATHCLLPFLSLSCWLFRPLTRSSLLVLIQLVAPQIRTDIIVSFVAYSLALVLNILWTKRYAFSLSSSRRVLWPLARTKGSGSNFYIARSKSACKLLNCSFQAGVRLRW